MAIAHVSGQSLGAPTDNATTANPIAYANPVTAGNMLVVVAIAFKPSNDGFVVGDISQTAGTATLGSWSLDKQNNYNFTGTSYLDVAIFTALVTGTGTCTVTVGGAPSGSYWEVAIDEFSGSWDASRLESSNAAQAATGTIDSGNATSAGAALFIGGLSYNSSGITTTTEDAAFTLIDDEEDADTHATGAAIYRIVGSGTTDSASWTQPSANEFSAIVAVYKEAAGGGGGGNYGIFYVRA